MATLTESDLKELKELKDLIISQNQKINADFADIKVNMVQLKGELKEDIAELKGELKEDIAELKGDIKALNETVKGLDKRLDGIEGLNRFVARGIILAIAVGLVKYLFFSGKLI